MCLGLAADTLMSEIWEALDLGGVDTLDVGAPMVFVSDDIQYVKWRKFDQIHVSLWPFLFPRTHAGLSERWGIFGRLQPFGGHGSNAGSRSI